MKSLGEYLRAERQARGISLEQIFADTRISMEMLRAIENGNVEQLPAPIFIKGFLKAYAEKIGLDPEEVIVEYQNLIEEAGDHQEGIEKFHQRLQPQSSNKKLLVLVIALAHASFGLYHYNMLGTNRLHLLRHPVHRTCRNPRPLLIFRLPLVGLRHVLSRCYFFRFNFYSVLKYHFLPIVFVKSRFIARV